MTSKTISDRFNYHFATDEEEAEFNNALIHLTDEEAAQFHGAVMNYKWEGDFDGFIILAGELAPDITAHRLAELLWPNH